MRDNVVPFARPTPRPKLTDQEKVAAIAAECRDMRRLAIENGRQEVIDNGWNAELGYHHLQFDLCGHFLEVVGEHDDLNWARDALGVGEGAAPPPKTLDWSVPK